MKNPIRSKEEQIRKQEADIAKKTHEKALLEQPLSQTHIDFTSNSLYTVRPCQEGGGGGGSQVACRNFKMSRVGVLSRVHVAVGN